MKVPENTHRMMSCALINPTDQKAVCDIRAGFEPLLKYFGFNGVLMPVIEWYGVLGTSDQVHCTEFQQSHRIFSSL